jgi:type IV secretion system protein VirB6
MHHLGQGRTVAGNLWDKGGVLIGDFGFYLAGAIVWCLIGVLCVYAMFLIALSSIAWPFCWRSDLCSFAMLFFDATKRLFVAWVAQLTNYALITVLTVMVAALLLHVVQSYAAQTAARGTAILTVDALHMMLIAVLVFLVLRQVMPIASGLAGGVAINSFSVASRGVGWGLRSAGRIAAPSIALAAPLVARGGQYVYDKAGAGVEALGRSWRHMRR